MIGVNPRNARVAAALFECDGGPLLVMASGAHRVDTTLLRAFSARSRSQRQVRSWCVVRPTR